MSHVWKVGYLFQALLTTSLAVYDLRTRRVPNEIVLPWFFVALVVTMGMWPAEGLALRLVFPLMLFLLWHLGVLGGADAKVWTALWLTTPPEHLLIGLSIAGLCLFFGGLVGLLIWKPGSPAPGLWKAVPYGAWLAWTVWR